MWRIKGKARLGMMGYIFPKAGVHLPEYQKEIEKNFKKCNLNDGPWDTYSHKGIYFAIYRKRFFVYHFVDIKKGDSVDSVIRLSIENTDKYIEVIEDILPDNLRFRTYRIAFIDKIRFKRSRRGDDIIDEGITTFNMRINDSDGNAGMVRISTHLLLCAGLKGNVLQEAINMCYEKMLTFDEDVNAEKVFDFLSGLSRFTIPSEENRFLQKAVVKVTILLTIMPVLFELVYHAEFSLTIKLSIILGIIGLLIFLVFKPLFK